MDSETIITLEITAIELDMLAGIIQVHLDEYHYLAPLLAPLARKLAEQNAAVITQIRAAQAQQEDA